MKNAGSRLAAELVAPSCAVSLCASMCQYGVEAEGVSPACGRPTRAISVGKTSVPEAQVGGVGLGMGFAVHPDLYSPHTEDGTPMRSTLQLPLALSGLVLLALACGEASQDKATDAAENTAPVSTGGNSVSGTPTADNTAPISASGTSVSGTPTNGAAVSQGVAPSAGAIDSPATGVSMSGQAAEFANADSVASSSSGEEGLVLAGPVATPEPEAELPTAEPIDGPSVDSAPIATNPYVDVSHDPLSTFAVDVDTASYDIFRRDVLNGRLPTPSTVRLEEFVNYFDYDYPAPEAGADEPFSISLAAAPSFIDNGTTLLRVGIQGELAPEFEKKPANLVFLVDVSGSMQSAEKLPLVQSVLNQAVGILEEQDTVSIVTYASGTGVALEPTPAADADAIRAVINNLTAGGSTNGAGGIQLAYEQARAAYLEGGINHVILCTDGDFNVGVSTTDGLVDLIEEERKSGVTFTALGFGANNNDAMMEAVSNAGNGMYGVIATAAQAETYVAERLLHNLTLIAKDVKIQVEFNPEHVAAYRLLGYENRAIADQDFRNDTVDAGEIGAEHRVTALYELVMTGGQVPSVEDAPEMDSGEPFDGEAEVAAEDLVLVKVRYKDVDASEQDEAYEVARSLTPEDVASSPNDLDADFRWAMAIAAFAEILKGSPYAEMSNLPQLESIFVEQAERDNERSEFAALFSTTQNMLSAAQ
jgi:Ca-activated chloride channel homolog